MNVNIKLKGVYINESHIKYAEDNFLNMSELIRYLIDNYEPYKEWLKNNGKQ